MSDSGSTSSRTPTPAAPAGPPAGAVVCTACALVCTDFRPGAGVCQRGDEAIRLRHSRAAMRHEAWIDGAPAAATTALGVAAARLRAARRVLVTGLGAVTVEEARLACDLAESLGAALSVTARAADAADHAALARSGAVTAAWEELRDRADLVLFWFHDPSPALPRFTERFVAPSLPSGRRRITLAVGGGPMEPGGSCDHRSLDLPGSVSVALARVLAARIGGRPVAPSPPGVESAAETILALVDGAGCVGIVTGDDPVGTERLAVTGLLRALAPRMPAFEIPADDAPPNAAGAEAVLAWRYGVSGDVAHAAPDSLATAPVSPVPFDAATGLRRGAFDAVLTLGPVVGTAAAHEASDAAVEVVAIDPGVAPHLARGVQLRCREPADTAGTIVRADGTSLALAGSDAAESAPTVGAMLRRLSAELAATAGGSR